MALMQRIDLKASLKKYRYPLIVLLIGFLLLFVSSKKNDPVSIDRTAETVRQSDLSAELKQILMQIDGVGNVELMLSISAGEKTIYQTDENNSNGTIRTETVIITDSSRNQQALVTQVQPITYRGAIIVCQGADNQQIKLAIVEAVSRLTGLGADCISVLKMK